MEDDDNTSGGFKRAFEGLTLEQIKQKFIKESSERKLSRLQELALDLAERFNEPKKISFWMGIVKRFGVDTVYMTFQGMRDGKAPNSPALLIYLLKKNYGIKKEKKADGNTSNNSR